MVNWLLFSTFNILYVGTVMTSFYYACTQIRASWFRTNQSEQESYDREGDTVTSVCVTNKTDMALQGQIAPNLININFVTLFWCTKTEITDGTGILVLVRVL